MLILYSGIEIYFNESKEKNGIDYVTISEGNFQAVGPLWRKVE